MSGKKALMMLTQPPADCSLDRQLDVLDHAAEKGVLLMQDAVFLLATDGGRELLERGGRVYALRQSVEARGIIDRVMDGVELVDYDRSIDLIMDEYDIVV